MGKLLKENVFDNFHMRKIEISTDFKIEISELSKAEGARANYWAAIRPLILHIIKTGAKPSLIKIIFSLPDTASIHTNAAALFLNLSYENDEVSFTTATSQREFEMDKTLDTCWDEWVRNFFCNKDIAVKDRL